MSEETLDTVTPVVDPPSEAPAAKPKNKGGRPKGSKNKRNDLIAAAIGGSLKIVDWNIPRDGRTRFVDFAVVERLASIGCTMAEIELVLGFKEKSFRHNPKYRARFYQAYELGMARCKMSVRRAQFIKGVEQGNAQVLIWLGKQILGQKEALDIHSAVDTSISVKHKLSELSVEDLRKLAASETGQALLGQGEEPQEVDWVPSEDDNGA